MTVALVLAAYALLAATCLPVMLDGAGWTGRAPRLAIAMWQALTASAILAAALAGVSVAMSSLQVGGTLGQLLHDCALLLREQYGADAGRGAAAIGLLLAIGVPARSLWMASRELARDWRWRLMHLDKLTLAGRWTEGVEAVIVEHPQPAAYCVPGRRHRIVLTSAALNTLSAAELAAVLAHERAHVQGRHHIVLIGARAAAFAFPLVPLFRLSRQEIARLVELVADDVAAGQSNRSALAAALLRVAAGRAPAGGLAANGGAVTRRVQRLLAPRDSLGLMMRALVGLLATSALVGPVLLVLWPVLGLVAGLYGHVCPLEAG